MAKKKLSIKWAENFIHGIIPLRILLILVDSFRTYENIEYWTNLITIFFIINACYIILMVFTYFYAKKYTKIGYKLLYSLFIIDTLIFSISAVNNVSVGSTNEYILILLILIFLTFLIWLLPNYIYFKKRKHLFINKVD